jgi:hypothetical protein
MDIPVLFSRKPAKNNIDNADAVIHGLFSIRPSGAWALLLVEISLVKFAVSQVSKARPKLPSGAEAPF